MEGSQTIQDKMIEQGRLSYRSVVDSTIILIVSDIVVGAEGNFRTTFCTSNFRKYLRKYY